MIQSISFLNNCKRIRVRKRCLLPHSINIYNNCKRIIYFYFFAAAYKNCAEIYKSGNRTDGVYTIAPDNLFAFDVFCDQTRAGGGWTVFQKGVDGSVDFFSIGGIINMDLAT